jgi:hypothetical protein
MRAPNCLWPREKNGSDGLGVRLGRVLHWVCATIAFLLIALGLVLAAVAILSGPANAQADARAKQTNETYPGWKELPKNAVLDDNSETSVPVQNAESRRDERAYWERTLSVIAEATCRFPTSKRCQKGPQPIGSFCERLAF